MTPRAPEHRAYGQACRACRQKKRKCLPCGHRRDICASCEKTGEACEMYSKRRRKTQTDDASSPIDSVACTSTSHQQERPFPTHSLLGLHYDSTSASDPRVVSDSAVWISPSASNATGRPSNGTSPSYRNSGAMTSATDLDQEATPRPMAIGHGSTYILAMSDLVHRVCGDSPESEINETLLAVYFAWQGPQHMPVNERLFRRDMQSRPNGVYFSPLLLHAIHAQASRHVLSRDDGWAYADRANALLVASLSDAPCIPTIQALLILSGRDLAMGSTSAGWLKCGMAFRMITELGLEADASTDTSTVRSEHREHVEMRQRVFWSAYSWDKFFALTLGRQPTFRLPAKHIKVPIFADHDYWMPFAPEAPTPSYPAHLSLTGETFHALSLLNIELEAIIMRLYGNRQTASIAAEAPTVTDLCARLLAWRQRVSPSILLDTSYLPPTCPPPHILTLNLLYRTTWILLQRPLIRHAEHHIEARQNCVSRSVEIHSLFELHEKTFALRNITYIMAYMAYISATVDVAEALSGDGNRSTTAVQRLELTLRVLNQAVRHTPGIHRSLHHLRHKLNHSGRTQSNVQSGAATPTTAHPVGSVTLTAEQVSQAIESEIQSTDTTAEVGNAFGGFPPNIGFEELFAALLPEFPADATMYEQGQQSTANLPMMDETWDWWQSS